MVGFITPSRLTDVLLDTHSKLQGVVTDLGPACHLTQDGQGSNTEKDSSI